MARTGTYTFASSHLHSKQNSNMPSGPNLLQGNEMRQNSKLSSVVMPCASLRGSIKLRQPFHPFWKNRSRIGNARSDPILLKQSDWDNVATNDGPPRKSRWKTCSRIPALAYFGNATRFLLMRMMIVKKPRKIAGICVRWDSKLT